jgi:hypothetical protein
VKDENHTAIVPIPPRPKLFASGGATEAWMAFYHVSLAKTRGRLVGRYRQVDGGGWSRVAELGRKLGGAVEEPEDTRDKTYQEFSARLPGYIRIQRQNISRVLRSLLSLSNFFAAL